MVQGLCSTQSRGTNQYTKIMNKTELTTEDLREIKRIRNYFLKYADATFKSQTKNSNRLLELANKYGVTTTQLYVMAGE